MEKDDAAGTYRPAKGKTQPTAEAGRIVYEAMSPARRSKERSLSGYREHTAENFIFDPTISHPPHRDLIMCRSSSTTPVVLKQALYKAIAETLRPRCRSAPRCLHHAGEVKKKTVIRNASPSTRPYLPHRAAQTPPPFSRQIVRRARAFGRPAALLSSVTSQKKLDEETDRTEAATPGPQPWEGNS